MRIDRWIQDEKNHRSPLLVGLFVSNVEASKLLLIDLEQTKTILD
ncbi:MAG: hypothetical protein R6U17_03335 [Thermoplasmata archaeon]